MARPRGQRRSGRRSLTHSEPLSGLCHRHGDHHGDHRVDHHVDHHFDHHGDHRVDHHFDHCDDTDNDDGIGDNVPLFAKNNW